MAKPFKPTREELQHAISVRRTAKEAARYLGVAACTFVRACNRLGVTTPYKTKRDLSKKRRALEKAEKEENKEKRHPFRRFELKGEAKRRKEGK